MQYKAKMGISVILTTSSILFLIIWFLKLAINSIEDGANNTIAYFLSSIFVFGISVYSFLAAPRRYIVNKTNFIVKRIITDYTINLNDITNVIDIPNSQSWKFVKSFGISGLFGNIGKFYHRRYKYTTFFASRNSNLVLIETKAKNYIISPGGKDFVERLKNRLNLQ